MSAEADEPRARVLALLRVHGWNATSFQVLEPGYRYWFTPEGDGCVAYLEVGRAWVAAGAPIAGVERLAAVAHAFIAAARAAKRRASFFAVEERFCATVGLPAFKIGEQPHWDAQAWPASLTRSLKEQLRRAHKKGVTVRRASAEEVVPGTALRAAIEDLARIWLATRPLAPMGFLVDIEPFLHSMERHYFVAERDGVLVAFLAAVPIYGRGGWLIEDLLRRPDAPNGTTELLVDLAMTRLAAEGAGFVTLGMVPLAGVAGWLAAVRDRSRLLYDFRGLAAFKHKLRPAGNDDIFLAHAPEVRPPCVLLDALRAFARGSLLRFGVDTVLRGGPPVLFGLGTALVPWTLVLALAPASWFPHVAVQAAWVGFDAALAVALLVLARGYRRGLGRALAWVVTGDALITWTQALAWNVPRIHDWSAGLALLAGCLAPALGALILWRALARHY